MKKLLIIIIVVCNINICYTQWIPDTNKIFYLQMVVGAGYGSALYTVKDTLYVGGNFIKVSGINALNIAKYNNGNWYQLKGGVSLGNPNSFIYNILDSCLYVSGYFNSADNKPGTRGLARWDGNNWWPIGTSSNCAGCLGTMEYYDNKIFFSGSNMLGMAWGVIAWDGTNWTNKCNLPPIMLLRGFDNDLLAGDESNGIFLRFLGDTNWEWQPYGGMNGGTSRAVKDTVNNLLYLAGSFFWVIVIVNPLLSVYMAMYDGFEWHSMGNAPNYFYCMQMYNGYLYAGLTDSLLSDGTQVNYIARWDWGTEQWYPLGAGLDNWANAMEEFHDTLFVTGGFTTAGGDSAYGIARWYMPDTGCHYLWPMIHNINMEDTFYLGTGQVAVQFFNNNAYVQSWQWDFGDMGTANTQNPEHTYTTAGTYNVSVTVTDNGCIKTAERTIYVLNGVQSEQITKEGMGFKVYPNPTTGDFTIECTLPQNKTGMVKAYRPTGSELGQKALESGFNKLTMPANKWKENVILVAVYVEGKQVFVEKVIKE